MSDIVLILWESCLKGVVKEAKFTRFCFGRTYWCVCAARVPNENPLAHRLKGNLWHEIHLLCVCFVKTNLFVLKHFNPLSPCILDTGHYIWVWDFEQVSFWNQGEKGMCTQQLSTPDSDLIVLKNWHCVCTFTPVHTTLSLSLSPLPSLSLSPPYSYTY